MSLPRSGASLLAIVLLGLAVAAVPTAAASLHTCHLTTYEQQHLGGTYVTELRVAHVSCTRGKQVVRAFHSCRAKHGGVKGRCPKSQSVLGYHCTEQRAPIATQFTSVVTCAFGSRRVKHYYTQNT